jgi:hypothetical protein
MNGLACSSYVRFDPLEKEKIMGLRYGGTGKTHPHCNSAHSLFDFIKFPSILASEHLKT